MEEKSFEIRTMNLGGRGKRDNRHAVIMGRNLLGPEAEKAFKEATRMAILMAMPLEEINNHVAKVAAMMIALPSETIERAINELMANAKAEGKGESLPEGITIAEAAQMVQRGALDAFEHIAEAVESLKVIGGLSREFSEVLNEGREKKEWASVIVEDARKKEKDADPSS